MTMIKAHRRSIPRASTVRLPVFAITSAAILLAASSIALSQEKQSNPAREPSANVQFVAGHSALNIPFDYEFNEIVLQVRVNDSAPLKFLFDTVKATGVGGTLKARWRPEFP